MDDASLKFLRSEEIGAAPFLRSPEASEEVTPLPYQAPSPVQIDTLDMMLRVYEHYRNGYVDPREIVCAAQRNAPRGGVAIR